MPYCRECGNEVAEHANFCRSCGATIGASPTESQAPPAQGERPVQSTTPEPTPGRGETEAPGTGPGPAPTEQSIPPSLAQGGPPPAGQAFIQKATAAIPAGCRDTLLKRIGLGCGGLFFIMMIIGVIVSAIGGDMIGESGASTPTPKQMAEPTGEPAATPTPGLAYPPCKAPEEVAYLETQQELISQGRSRISDLDEVGNTALVRQADLTHTYVRNLLKEKGDAVKKSGDDLKNYRDVPETMKELDSTMDDLGKAMNDYQNNLRKSLDALGKDNIIMMSDFTDKGAKAQAEIKTLRSDIREEIKALYSNSAEEAPEEVQTESSTGK